MHRRSFLRDLVLSAAGAGLLSACDNREGPVRYTGIPPLKPAGASMDAIPTLLEELRLAFEARGMHVTPSLLPGIAPAELAKRCQWFPAELPPEIVALYGWHNGQKNQPWDEAFPFWFRDNGFSSIENAEQEYKSMMESYGKEMPASLAGVDLKFCFPFAAFNGGWYVFPCHGQALKSQVARPVVSVFQGVDVLYASVESMLRTCVAWLKDPASLEEAKVQAGMQKTGQGADWKADQQRVRQAEQRWQEIWEQYNPGVR